MKVILPIFFHTDETVAKKDAGLPYHMSEMTTRDVIFYSIDTISPWLDNDADETEYTQVWSSGSSYICPIKIRHVEDLIDEAMNNNLKINI